MGNGKVLIYGFGAVGGIISALIDRKNFPVIYTYSRSLMSVEPSEAFGITARLPGALRTELQYEKNRVDIRITDLHRWQGEPIDLIICAVKANGIESFRRHAGSLLGGKWPQVAVLANGKGWETGLDGVPFFRLIVLFNAVCSGNDAFEMTSSGGLLAEYADEQTVRFLFDYRRPEEKASPSAIPEAGQSLVRYVDDIEPYIYRKLWLNTLNGFFSKRGGSLRDFFMTAQPDELEGFVEYLEETGALFERAGIRSLPLPDLDPQWLISLAKKKMDISAPKETLSVNTTTFTDFSNEIARLPSGLNSTAQSLARNEQTEYRWIGGTLCELADKTGVAYTMNREITEWVKKAENKSVEKN